MGQLESHREPLTSGNHNRQRLNYFEHVLEASKDQHQDVRKITRRIKTRKLSCRRDNARRQSLRGSSSFKVIDIGTIKRSHATSY